MTDCVLGPDNNIGAKGAAHLAGALAKNKTLLDLNLECEWLCD